MNRTLLLPCAFGLDLLAGDPEWLPHPVRMMGFVITQGEAALRVPQRSSRADLASGALLTISVVAGSYLATDQLLRFTHKRSPRLGLAAEILLAWTCIAARSLHDEASTVLKLLDTDLTPARRRLARIVGRDTGNLDTNEISRAVIETVAESLSDGVLAPVFYLAIGGVPLAMAYKAINTLDSMIGHADERYFYFGKFAARLDDLANLLPARLSALAIVCSAALLPGCDGHAARTTWLADHAKHKSPNAGHPESAMAGALRVRLGGENHYAGEPVRTPYLGEAFPSPSLQTARTSLKVAAVATVLGIAVCSLLAWTIQREPNP
jgi:adenosylcobinamide-phosphate synthase